MAAHANGSTRARAVQSRPVRCSARRPSIELIVYCSDHMCDMAFDCNLMADPVVASDGFTYERWAMEQW